MMLTTLFFHQIVENARPEHQFLRSATTLQNFREMMITLKDRFHPLGIDEVVWAFKNGRTCPRNSVLLTFDDGFKNNLWAAEVLHELGMTATFSVITQTIDTQFQPWYITLANCITYRQQDRWSCSWGDVDFTKNIPRRRWLKATKDHLLSLRPSERADALEELATATGTSTKPLDDPDLAFFSSADLKKLLELGMTVGGHSQTHDNLARCSPAELQVEMVDSSDQLEQILGGVKVRYFCYPDGRFNDAVVEVAKKRFDAAFASSVHYSLSDLWRFPRRAADGCENILPIMSPLYPLKRLGVHSIKFLLGI